MATLLICGLSTAAIADPGDDDGTSTNATPHGTGFGVDSMNLDEGVSTPGEGGQQAPGGNAQAAAQQAPTCDVDFTIPCMPVTECREEPASPLGGILLLHNNGWIDNLGWCDPSVPEAPPTITPGMVLRAFRQVPLPASKIVVQPPNGRTLVNLETNFYTEAEPFERTVTLLGQKVTLNIWPSSYVWHYGDKTSDTTDTPGAPHPDLLVTHEYEHEAKVKVSVDTIWSAEFRVNGGPWQNVSGTVAMDGATEPLNVVEATPVLTGDNY